MLNATSINALAHAALQSLNEIASPFECKRWRSNGFSDSEIFQLVLPSGIFAIRSWPNRFDSPSKVSFWSNLNNEFSANGEGLKQFGATRVMPFPRVYDWRKPGESATSLLLFENQLWSLSDWVVGQSMASRVIDQDLAKHLATILGRIHATTITALDRDGTPIGRHRMRSHSLNDRQALLKSLDHRLFSAIDRNDFFLASNLSDRLKHCIATVLERKGDWDRFLKICSSQERECHWIVRDLWRENILLDSDNRFAAIVDLGAARLDWPGLDFIRLFGSLSCIPESSLLASDSNCSDLWRDVYLAYTDEHPEHSLASLDECRMLHQVSSGLAVLQWVLWITGGTISLQNSAKDDRVALRLAELCDQFLIETAMH